MHLIANGDGIMMNGIMRNGRRGGRCVEGLHRGGEIARLRNEVGKRGPLATFSSFNRSAHGTFGTLEHTT